MGDITLFGIPISFGTMIYQAIIFTVLVFILKKLVFKKLVNILDNRKQHIENQLQLTEKYKLDAEKNLETSEIILKQARADSREIRKHSESEAKLILQEAKDKAKQILKEAKEEAFLSRSRSFSQKDQFKGA
ncbi:ATP synthase F0 subunit B [Neobacillus sp. NPDC093127]|uniref:ATP synthase F0 subunit B n=1 Tax=Neobacillus sp. NPDC093127 TaxID=3364296 RepID=UPI0038072E71